MTQPQRDASLSRPPPPPHAPMPRGLLLLAALIAGIEIVLAMADAGLVFSPYLRLQVFETGAFWTALLRGDTPMFAAQPATMFLSHALLHGSLVHMAMNMAVLLALGRFTADHYGPGAVLPVFAAGAVAGGGAFALLSASPYPMVGASGAVFAFLGIWIAWDWRRHRAAGASVRPVATRVAVLAGINVVIYVGLGGMLAWEAHLGGFLAGLACAVWLEGRRAEADRRTRAAARLRRDAPGAAGD